MQHLGKLISDHEALDEAADALLAIARCPHAAPSEAFDELCRFACAVEAHNAVDASFMYADHSRPAPTRFDIAVEDFHSAFADLAPRWQAYVAKWTRSAIAQDWANFARETLEIIERKKERIARENRMIYPLALQFNRIRLRPG